MKMNRIKLKLNEKQTLSIVQKYDDENGDLLCNEMALIDASGVNDPIPYGPYLDDFMGALQRIIRGALK
jgi:hypothetical protein